MVDQGALECFVDNLNDIEVYGADSKDFDGTVLGGKSIIVYGGLVWINK